jgi:hypothetical protein
MRKIKNMRGWNQFVSVMAGAVFALAQTGQADTLTQDFSADPAGQGWRVFGNTNLFAWDRTNQDLQVTWDSSQPDSYFYHNLGTVLGRDDDFSIAFDLRLKDIGPGANTNKSGAYELAVALLNFKEATSTNFLRGTGTDSPDLVEFDYFRDAGFGATIWPTFISSAKAYNYNGPGDYTLLGINPGDQYHIEMAYTASTAILATTMTRNGAPFGPINPVPLSTNFTDFRVDTFAICSYSDTGDDYDSLLAHGVVDNVVITTPAPPVTAVNGGITNGNGWQVNFPGKTNWVYTLERTVDLVSWTAASGTVSGGGTNVVLQDSAPRAAGAFYRVRAQKP